jgi:hypothetical protein
VGVDLLDFTFRIEKRFGFKTDREDIRMLDPLWTNRKPADVTAGELHQWIVKLCEARGMTVPYSSWNGVRLELARVVGKSPRIIHRDTWVIRELGFS